MQSTRALEGVPEEEVEERPKTRFEEKEQYCKNGELTVALEVGDEFPIHCNRQNF